MNPWMIFLIGSVLLTLVILGGFFLPRGKNVLDIGIRSAAQDIRLLVFLIWLASLSILAYIAFTFGKR